MADQEQSPQEDQLIQHLLERLGSPGWTPEDIEFLINNPQYEHRPVGIKEFITSEKYLNAEKECWPSVLTDLCEIFPDENILSLKMSPFSEIIRDMGIGSGKSFRITYMFCYVAFRLLCFKSPQEAYGLAPGSVMALVNASITAPQAKKVIFGDVSERIARSPWFQAFAQPNPNVASELRFPKKVVIFPGSSSETAALGYNVFMGNIDEAAFLTETEDRDVAQDIYDGFYNRELSRFSHYGLISAISSPRYVDDFVERKVDEAKANPNISAKVAPTWESNPRDVEAVASGKYFILEHPRDKDESGNLKKIKIPKKYEEAFRRNPTKAWRDFGAVASLALDPFFTNSEQEKLSAIVNAGLVYDPTLESMVPGPWEYYAHFDLGIKRDACGVAIGHPENGIVKIDLILRIVCANRAEQLSKKGEPYDLIIGKDQVDLEEVRNIIYRLSDKGFYFKKVSYDQFQSVDSRQQLESRGFLTELISVDRDLKAYDTLKDFITTNRFFCCAHYFFLIECLRLELKEGKKVDHPRNGSKDLADAVAGVCRSMAESNDDTILESEELIVDDSVQIKPIPDNI